MQVMEPFPHCPKPAHRDRAEHWRKKKNNTNSHLLQAYGSEDAPSCQHPLRLGKLHDLSIVGEVIGEVSFQRHCFILAPSFIPSQLRSSFLPSTAAGTSENAIRPSPPHLALRFESSSLPSRG
ncbi:hypothetical protein VTN96DRAFT_1105 [Rasamsonia emersonii]